MSSESEQQDDLRDLSKVVPNDVVSNQQTKKGQTLLFESDGLVHQVVLGNHLALADRYSNRVKGELEWFEQFVGHGPSVGAFHEHLIRMAITDVLPSRLKLGEGFVYDSNRELCSKQLDLIVYSDHDVPPIYRRDGFVIVSPASVVAVGEVKKTLRSSDIKEQIRATISSNFGTHSGDPHGVARLNIFCFRSDISTTRIVSKIHDELKAFLVKFEATTKGGRKATMGCCNLVLPSIFFLDRSECIHTRLIQDQNLDEKVVISVLDGDRGDSLHFFLEAMSDAERSGIASGDRSFLTTPLRNVKHEVILPENVFCIRQLAMEEIAVRFPKEKHYLQQLRFGDRKPFGAIVRARTDLLTLSSVAELTAQKGFQWVTARLPPP